MTDDAEHLFQSRIGRPRYETFPQKQSRYMRVRAGCLVRTGTRMVGTVWIAPGVDGDGCRVEYSLLKQASYAQRITRTLNEQVGVGGAKEGLEEGIIVVVVNVHPLDW